jgi:hypothetical protein
VANLKVKNHFDAPGKIGNTESDPLSGAGRCRKKKQPTTKLPSHYQFARWEYEDGKRRAVPVDGVRTDKRGEYPLISTTIKNEGSGTETLIWLHFDLDYKRADRIWRKDGKLDWPTISRTLEAEIPLFHSYLSYAVRSSGGQGLSLVLAISPLELIPETIQVQKLAAKLQSMIIDILNSYGMGADKGAKGLKRLMPNVFQADRVLDHCEITEANIQKIRPRVIQNLLQALSSHPALKAANKKDRTDLLWADIRLELPCARLYMDLLDSAGPWGSEQMTASEITRRYGISKNSVYKFLATPPAWLGAEQIPGEGWRLTIRPSQELTDRALSLLETGGQGKSKDSSFASFHALSIPAPESVEDGGRNQWLVALVLACKWKGVERASLLSALKNLVKRVPGYQHSRSLTRELQTIVRSLYHHRGSLYGQEPELVLPEWLTEALTLTKPKQLSQIFPKKGTCVAGYQAAVPAAEPRCDLEAASLAHSRSSSPATGGVRPGGSGGGPGPRSGGDDPEPLLKAARFDTVPSVTPTTAQGSANSFDPGPAFSAGPAGADEFSQLSGSALSGAFSKALMKSGLPASEKARILTEVTSETDAGVKDQLRRRWLSTLQR